MCGTAEGLHWETLYTPSGTQKLAKGNVGMGSLKGINF